MQIKFEKGFTLIEVIVVVSVAAILTTVGIASFSSYNQTEKVKTASLELVNALNTAKARAQSQEKPSGCVTLNKYRVGLCFQAGACESGETSRYVLYAECEAANTLYPIYKGKFPAGVSFGTTQSQIFYFNLLTGSIDFAAVSPASIAVTDSTTTKTIQVYTDGRIILND